MLASRSPLRHLSLRGLLPAIALTLAVAAAAPPVRAATVRALDLTELVQTAELIVVGQPRERQARWGHRGKLIVTDVSIRVEETLKGDPGSGADLVVTHLGGAIGDLGLKVPGSAGFSLGQTAVVFLHVHPATGEWRAVGMSQGVLPVETTDGVRTVSPGGHGAELMQAGPGGRLRPAPGALTDRVRLSDFTAEVRRLVLQQKRDR